MPTKDERLLATLIYVTSIFAPIIGPLIIWLIKKDESSFVDYHGKEYFNLFISYAVYFLISFVLMIILIGFVLIWILGIVIFVLTIIAAIKAYEGKEYHFPLIFRLIR